MPSIPCPLFRIAFTAWLLVLLASSLPTRGASWSPDGKQLAYSFIGGPESIYLIHPDGTEHKPLVVREQRDFRPEWAPDGSHLVFTSVVDGVHVMMRVNPDGSGVRQLSDVKDAAGDPDYSPDGRRLLYFTDEPLPRDLFVRDIETGQVTALTDTADVGEASPRWAPDGRRVVFVGTQPEEDAKGDIWTLDSSTGERRNLTATPEVSEFHPDWSHDGSRVVYIRVEAGRFGVAVRNLDNGVETLVADGNGYAVLDPHFSPDDRFLTFTRTDFAEKGEGMPAIVLLEIDTGTETTIVKGLYLSQMDQKTE